MAFVTKNIQATCQMIRSNGIRMKIRPQLVSPRVMKWRPSSTRSYSVLRLARHARKHEVPPPEPQVNTDFITDWLVGYNSIPSWNANQKWLVTVSLPHYDDKVMPQQRKPINVCKSLDQVLITLNSGVVRLILYDHLFNHRTWKTIS